MSKSPTVTVTKSTTSDERAPGKSRIALVGLVHLFSLLSALCYIGGLSSLEHELREWEDDGVITKVIRRNATSFPWFLLAGYALLMILHLAFHAVKFGAFAKLWVAILLGSLLAMIGYALDKTIVTHREVNAPTTPDGIINSLITTEAGAVGLCISIVGAILVSSLMIFDQISDMIPHSTTSAYP